MLHLTVDIFVASNLKNWGLSDLSVGGDFAAFRLLCSFSEKNDDKLFELNLVSLYVSWPVYLQLL